MKNTTQQSENMASAPTFGALYLPYPTGGRGPAYVFTGFVDGEWTNLMNWEDINGNWPASSLPTALSDVVITGLVDTIPLGITADVKDLTINATGEVRIEIRVHGSATIRGIVGLGEKNCGTGEITMLGESIAFRGNGENRSKIDTTFGGDMSVDFFDDSKQYGVVTGDVDLYGNSSMTKFGELANPICGTLTMHNDSVASDFSAESLVMYNYATASNGSLISTLDMHDHSSIENDISNVVTVIMRDNAHLQGPGTMTILPLTTVDPNGDQVNVVISAKFSEDAYIGANYTVVGDCVFEEAGNSNLGTIQGNLSAYGGGLPARLGNVTGTATLTDDIYDDLFLP